MTAAGGRAGAAIVTGSESGIGRATAVALARAGFDVGVTWHRDPDAARRTAAEVRSLGREAAVRELHLDPADTAAAAIGTLADELSGLDVLVNNAATGHTDSVLDLQLDTWRHVLEVDLTGAFVVAQAAARRMVAASTPGRIINVTSVHERVPLRGAAAYCAAKGGLGLLTKVMALELAQHGITVNAVAPGEIATPMTGAADVDPHTLQRRGIPARRPGDAREVAALIAFLAGPHAAYATGSSIVIDGGLTLMAAEANIELR